MKVDPFFFSFIFLFFEFFNYDPKEFKFYCRYP